MAFISTLGQSQLGAANNSAFDIERRELVSEWGKNWRKIDDLR